MKRISKKTETSNELPLEWFTVRYQPSVRHIKDKTVLEKEPLEKITDLKELKAFKHEGFWQCMDTKRDRDLLEELWSSGKALWK